MNQKLKKFWCFFSLMLSLSLLTCKDNNADPTIDPDPKPDTTGTNPPPPPAETAFTDPNAAAVRLLMVDKNATEETAALFYNLKKSSITNIMVGQQDAFNGFFASNGTNDETSDMKLLTGKNPALLGLDFMFITDEENTGMSDNWWHQQELGTISQAKKAYKRGEVLAFTWHFRGDFSKRSFYVTDLTNDEKQKVFRSILEGGTNHEYYKTKLKKIADIANLLKDENGKPIPFIFRPFHEFDGDWFWWGKSFCTPEEYKQNFRFTVNYLRDELGVHNILYSFAPDNRFTTEAVYLERYPGNEYVDIVGFDNYGDYSQGTAGINNAALKLKIISEYAKKNKKVAALTETGLRVEQGKTLTPGDFYTNIMLKSFTKEKLELAFVMFWGNSKDGYYVPAPGASGASNFIEFEKDSYTIFEDEIAGKLYTFPQ